MMLILPAEQLLHLTNVCIAANATNPDNMVWGPYQTPSLVHI